MIPRLLFFFFILFQGISIQAQDYSIASIDNLLISGSNSVLIEEKIDVDVSNPSKVVTYVKQAVCVLNEKGNAKVNSYAFYDDDRKIKKIDLYIYNALGKEINHFKQRDFKDVSAADGFSLYNDDRVLYFDYTPQSYPYTAVFEVETVSRTTAFLPSWHPVLGYASSTKQSEYKITFDPANKPNYKAVNLEDYTISIEETPSQIRVKANNIRAIKYEEHAPSFYEYAPKVSFALERFKLKGVDGLGDSWDSFGAWMQQQLLEGTDQLSQQTVNEVTELVATCKTNEEKARKVYQYLQDKVRYISVQIGIGGWKPMLASDVDALSYGDCKALTNYTKALLDAVGVQSYYTILHSGTTEKDISKDFVAMQGNHAILGVQDNDEIIWLECTSQNIPFGFVPSSNANRDVLIITNEGGKIVRTKSYTSKESKQETKATIKVLDGGGITATVNRTSTGLQYEDSYRLEKKESNEIEKHYKNLWNSINALTINDVEFINNKEAVVFTENVEISAETYCTKVGENYLFTINTFNKTSYIPPRNSDREKEIEIKMGYWDEDIYRVEFPSGFNIESLPEDKKLITPFGSYNVEFKMDENILIYKRSILINKGVYPSSTYGEFRDFYKKIAKIDNIKVLLKGKS